MTRIAFDTNILAYLAGVAHVPADDAKVERVRTLIERLSAATLVAPVQALGELFVVLLRAKLGAEQARETIADLIETFETPASEPRTALGALDLAVDHKLQFWDALIFTAAADAGCTMLHVGRHAARLRQPRDDGGEPVCRAGPSEAGVPAG